MLVDIAQRHVNAEYIDVNIKTPLLKHNKGALTWRCAISTSISVVIFAFLLNCFDHQYELATHQLYRQ